MQPRSEGILQFPDLVGDIKGRRLKWFGNIDSKGFWWWCIYSLTHSLMELSPSWEAANCAATQELPSILWNPKVHCRVHKSPPLFPILGQIDPVHTIQSYLSKIQMVYIFFFLICIVWGGVQTGSTRHVGHLSAYCTCPGWLWRWRNWWNEWQGKPKYSEKTCPDATFSTTNPTWPDPGLNPGRRDGKPATNRFSFSYGAAIGFLDFVRRPIF
jgi:hypothetical protein